VSDWIVMKLEDAVATLRGERREAEVIAREVGSLAHRGRRPARIAAEQPLVCPRRAWQLRERRPGGRR
jgi:hypothetical protein